MVAVKIQMFHRILTFRVFLMTSFQSRFMDDFSPILPNVKRRDGCRSLVVGSHLAVGWLVTLG